MYKVYEGIKLIKQFDDLMTAVKYASNASNSKIIHHFDVVYDETGEVLATFRIGICLIDRLHDHMYPPKEEKDLSVCTCDFSRGNWGCTCGHMDWVRAQKQNELITIKSDDDLPPMPGDKEPLWAEDEDVPF